MLRPTHGQAHATTICTRYNVRDGGHEPPWYAIQVTIYRVPDKVVSFLLPLETTRHYRRSIFLSVASIPTPTSACNQHSLDGRLHSYWARETGSWTGAARTSVILVVVYHQAESAEDGTSRRFYSTPTTCVDQTVQTDTTTFCGTYRLPISEVPSVLRAACATPRHATPRIRPEYAEAGRHSLCRISPKVPPKSTTSK